MAKSKKPGKKSENDSQMNLFNTGDYTAGSIIERGSVQMDSRVISFDQFKGQMLVKRFYEEAERLTKHLK